MISLQADGSAMYSLQALWTQARERLPCTTILLANRKYDILIGEYQGVGATPGPTAMSMLDLGNPDLDWVQLANGMGVEAARATTLEQCADLMRQSFRAAGAVPDRADDLSGSRVSTAQQPAQFRNVAQRRLQVFAHCVRRLFVALSLQQLQ